MHSPVSIFSHSGLSELSRFLSERCLVAFDFDGTLASIVDKPSDANLTAEVTDLLKQLSTITRVLILTGRSLSDARGRLPFEISDIIGNHGFEGCPSVTPETLEATKSVAHSWAQWLESRLRGDSHFFIELKDYSVAVHFRAAPIQEAARSKIYREAEEMEPKPRILNGKSVVNLIPPGLPDKYQAIVSFMTQHKFEKAIFVGDDITDNDIFRQRDPRILSIKVGRCRELLAPWFIEKQGEISELIQQLIMKKTTHQNSGGQ